MTARTSPVKSPTTQHRGANGESIHRVRTARKLCPDVVLAGMNRGAQVSRIANLGPFLGQTAARSHLSNC